MCDRAYASALPRSFYLVIAIDGKNLKGLYDREKSLKSLTMVSAWSSSHRLVLGQVAVEQKLNEITAIPLLLEQLDLNNASNTDEFEYNP